MHLGYFAMPLHPPARDWRSVLQENREAVVLADKLGYSEAWIGEHFTTTSEPIPSPLIFLATVIPETSHIRLGTAVVVLPWHNPILVAEQAATLDLLSGGRAEIMVGRGSFIESFPLFGFDLRDYDDLFAEHLELLLRLREDEIVTWPGGHRPAIDGRGVYPRPHQDPLPVWIAVGGTPESAVRAGMLGLPMALAIIGGLPERFHPFADLFRRTAREAGHSPLPALSINSHGYVAETSQQAADEAYPPLSAMMNRIARERGFSLMDREAFDASRALRGANFVGSPAEVAEKILWQHELFGHQRFLLQMIGGGMPHAQLMRSIELLGARVAPEVRRALATPESAISSR